MPNKRVVPCYGIRKGRDAPLVVSTWAEVVSKTSDFPGAEFKKFKSLEEANDYVQDIGQPAGGGLQTPGSYTLLFDGGSRGNPGVSGAGAALFDERDQEIWSGYKFIGDKNTNNEAEYSGLILGLEAAMRLGLRNVMVKGDSNLIIQQMNGRWRVTAPKLLEKYKQAQSVVKQGDLMCTWQHVSRSLNKRADLLANIAMDSRGEGEVFGQSPPVASAADPAAAAAAVAAMTATSATPSLPGIGASAAGATVPPPMQGAPPALAVTTGLPPSSAVSAAPAAQVGLAALGPAGVVPAAVTTASAPMVSVSTPARPVGGLVGVLGGASGVAGGAGAGGLKMPERRFMVHVAVWAKTDSVPGAVAAILYEEGSWRRLKALMRVARCSSQRHFTQDSTGAVEGTAVVADMLRVMGEALEEVEVLGGGKLAAITNEPQLSILLRDVTQSIRVPKANRPGEVFASNPSVSRVLQRWVALDGVLLEASDENEIASTIILARCCADPPPVSYLTWNRGPDNSNPPAGATPSVDSTTASVAASTAAGGARDTAAENPSPTLDVISSAPAGGGGGILGVVGAGSTVAASATTPVAAVTGPAHGVSRMAVAAPSPFPGFSGGSTGGVDVAAEAAAAAAAVAAEAEAGVEAAAGLVAPVAGVEGGAGLLKRPSPRIDVEGDDSGSVRKMPRTEEPGDRGGDVGGTVDVGGGTAIVTNDHIRI